MAATSIGQYVTMFQAERATRISTSIQERDRTMVQTRSRSEIRGRTPRKAAPTTTMAIPAWISRVSLRRRSSRSGVVSFDPRTAASSFLVPCSIAQGYDGQVPAPNPEAKSARALWEPGRSRASRSKLALRQVLG
jgi:hypothetical protein